MFAKSQQARVFATSIETQPQIRWEIKLEMFIKGGVQFWKDLAEKAFWELATKNEIRLINRRQ